MDFIKENWDKIKDTLRTEYDLSDISYNTWVKPLSFHSEKDDVVTIMIPSDQAHALKYISSKYKSYFQVTISEMMNHTYDISFILEKDADDEMLSAPGTVYNINYESANLNSKYRFDTFVVGGNNKFAHSASLAVAESPGVAYNPLYLYGGAGLGKTHLMHSIGHFILDQNPDMKVLYVTSEQFTNEVIESIRSGNAAKMNKLREKYRTVDVLLIDDVQFIIGKESTQEEFFHTFNHLHTSGKQIIISSDKPPKDMEILEDRIRSRFEWGLLADISSPDYETRVAILRKKEEMDGYNLDDAIIEYIAKNIKSNIRELEGSLNKIIAYAHLEKREITMELAETVLQDIISPNEKKIITPEYIVNTVAEHFDITPEDIAGSKRNSKIVYPRQIAMYLCRELTNIPLKSIGKCLGNRDHTTIMHGCEKIEQELQTTPSTQKTIDILKKKLQPGN